METEGAQPEEGQGTEVESGGDASLYAPFLEGVSEDLHEQVIPALKAQNGEFTKKFQERSEKVGPYEELGVFDMEPEAVGQLLTLQNTLTQAAEGDPQAQEAIYSWWDSVGEELGFYEPGEEGEGEPSEDDEFDPYDKNQLMNMFKEIVGEQVSPIAQHLQEKEMTEQQTQALQQAEAQVEKQIEDLKKDNPGLQDEDIGEILELAQLFADGENPVQAGFEKYVAYKGAGENDLFKKKLDQPDTPEGGGPNTPVPAKVTSANVKEIATKRLEQAMSL